MRHGQVKGYDSFPIYGHTDVELTQVGVLQMEHAAMKLKLCRVTAIYSSDLKRAATGARLIGCHHDVPINMEKDLREMYFGEWEGLTLAHLREQFPDELANRQSNLLHYRAPGDAESLSEFAGRVTKCFDKLLKDNPGGDIVIVAHGGTNRVILALALGMEIKEMFRLHQDYGCLNIIDYFPESALVRLING